ncbi:MAG TPA: flagellar biosynthetic protein FliR [Stellaceae bacterium]|nr:flagellar biosynthetic protein FliR [Stellaceae bacterium]
MNALQAWVPAHLFAPLLVFARLGSALMLLPGFGELYVPQRYRLLFALLLAVLVAPVLEPRLPPLPDTVPQLAALLGGEIVIGLFLGTMARFMLLALETAGNIISMQLGLSTAQVFNPLLGQESTLPGSMLMALGAMLVLATNTHHLMLRAAVDSYQVFAAGQMPAFGDLSDAVARVATASFRLGLELAAPFLVVGVVFFAALGVLGRLVPQLQIFFVTLPVQILGGLAIFALTLTAMMSLFLDHFSDAARHLIP